MGNLGTTVEQNDTVQEWNCGQGVKSNPSVALRDACLPALPQPANPQKLDVWGRLVGKMWAAFLEG